MIPGILISILTFPGVIVHEAGHLLMCRLLGVTVHKVRYFRFGNPAGYVIHDRPDSAWGSILIGIGPFLVNTIAGALCAGPFIDDAFRSGSTMFANVMTWLGVSIAMHSFPSTGDAKTVWSAVWAKGAPVTARLVGSPLVVVIFAGALGSVFWLDVAYGIVICLAAGRLFGLGL